MDNENNQISPVDGGQDRKYKFEDGFFKNRISGEVIPHDEPIIIFRARDVYAVSVLMHYHKLIKDPHHKKSILDRIKDFENFSLDNVELMKEPD